VGIILFVAGAGKVLGWFGGMGMDATINIFVTNMGIHPLLAYVSCYTEFIGGFLLIVGLLTRPAAFAIAINMLVAGIVTLPSGFMAGASYPFSMMVSSLVILLAGPMSYSLDAQFLSGRKEGAGAIAG
jgi:putative oxidoreductase